MAELTTIARDAICRDAYDLKYSELAALVGIEAHRLAHNEPVSRPDLSVFLRGEEGFGCEAEILRTLEKKRLVMRVGTSTETRWTTTQSAIGKIAGWLSVGWPAGARTQGAAE